MGIGGVSPVGALAPDLAAHFAAISGYPGGVPQVLDAPSQALSQLLLLQNLQQQQQQQQPSNVSNVDAFLQVLRCPAPLIMDACACATVSLLASLVF
jgi:hypothetical protein